MKWKKWIFSPSNYISSEICSLSKMQEINKVKSNLIINEKKEPYIFHFKRYMKPWFGISEEENKLVCFDFF